MKRKSAENLEAEMDMDVKGCFEGEGWVEGNLMSLGATGFLTQESEPSVKMLVDARNGFNKLRRPAMMWTVRHFWRVGARFSFNFYNYWVQLLLPQPG